MARIYLINVGANTDHASVARSPLFADGTFVYVPFPQPGKPGARPYPAEARPFTRNIGFHETHSDPDWPNLTYGDYCLHPRARALTNVQENDILLFWALLWRNTGNSWATFTKDRSWCLIGALRVRDILKSGQRPQDARTHSRAARAKHNAHFRKSKLEPGHRVFIGCTSHSQLFAKAVDLEVNKASGLLYKLIRTAEGSRLRLDAKPRWYSSLRPARPVWDLENRNERRLAVQMARTIRTRTGFHLLEGL